MNFKTADIHAFAMINPIQAIRTWYRNLSDRTEFKMQYDTRNQQQAIKPFLDSLDCQYQIVQTDLILVQSSVELKAKLDKLLFKPLFKQEGANTEYFRKLNKSTRDLFLDIKYQPEYNFELYLIDVNDWDKVKTTRNILKKLHTKPNDYFNHFMVIYRELSHEPTTV